MSLDDPDEADYIPSTVSLAFDIHSNNQNVCGNFVIVDDNLPPTVAEDDEYFLVSLSTSDNADVSPEDATAKVVIHDNDGKSGCNSDTLFVIVMKGTEMCIESFSSYRCHCHTG